MSKLLNGRMNRLKATLEPTASVEQIGPEEAAEFLESNAKNYRKLKRALVSRYASDMRQGLWTLTTGAIGIDVDGNLTNGQHRLHAVVESGIECLFVVVRNLPNTACEDPNEDTGSRRSVATHLQNMGVANANLVAATARFLWGLRSPGKEASRPRDAVSDAMVARIVAEDQRIAESAATTRCCSTVATPSVVSSWFWVASFEDPELALHCVAILSSQVDSSTMHPFAKLRDVLLQARSDKKSRGNMNVGLQFRYFMTAWAKAKQGETVKVLRPAGAVRIPDAADHALQRMGQ